MNSWTAYKHSLRSFYTHVTAQFHGQNLFPSSVDMVISFIVAQVNKGLSSATITTQLSAVSFVHKLANKPDPTSQFIIKKLLIGAGKINTRCDIRLPILKSILQKLVQSVHHVSESFYKASMLKSMYLLAFHAFLRPSEFTYQNKNNDHILQVKHINICRSKSKSPKSVYVTFDSYKHSKMGQSVTIHIKSVPDSPYCPVASLCAYLSIRGSDPGPLYIFQDKKPVSRSYFNLQLKKSLSWSGLQGQAYKPHSFRIGAATEAALAGIPDQKLKLMGRWHSDAYKKYIRVSVL